MSFVMRQTQIQSQIQYLHHDLGKLLKVALVCLLMPFTEQDYHRNLHVKIIHTVLDPKSFLSNY